MRDGARLNIYSIYRNVQPYFRTRRWQLFTRSFSTSPETNILDVGGYPANWDGVDVSGQITVVNVDTPRPEETRGGRITCIQADARSLPFADRSFDIVFSNSVIEHLGNLPDQRRFAHEVRRVGLHLFIRTPNRWFPIEPHFLAPLVHFLPKKIQMPLLRWCSVRGWLRHGDNVHLDSLFAELRLLDYAAMHDLFPDCRIVREKLAGMTKSLIATRTTLGAQ